MVPGLSSVDRSMLVRARAMEARLLRHRGFVVELPELYAQTTYEGLLAAHGNPETREELGEALGSTFEIGMRRLVIRYILVDASEENIPYMLGLVDVHRPLQPDETAQAFRLLRVDMVHRRMHTTTLIISLHDMTPALQNVCTQPPPVPDMFWQIEMFSVTELQLDPFASVLTGEHRLLSADEVAQLGLSKEQLPIERVNYRLRSRKKQVSEGSIAAKFIGAHDGDVLLIKRRNVSSMAGQHHLFYRVVRDVVR